MRRITTLLASLALLLTLAPVATLAAPQAGGAREAVIVVFHDSVANPVAAAEDLGRRHAFGLSYVYEHALKGFAASVPSGALNALARDPRVAWIEADQAVHAYADPDVPTGIERIFADDNPEITIDGTDDFRVDVDVAIIDTGIDLDHPDLNVNVADSVNCLNHSGGPPFRRTYSCEPGGDDDNEHGTHVAGTVGALDNGVNFNGVDVVGVAPGARLWAVKVLDANGSGSLGAVTAGIDYVTGKAGEIEVANMSLGCECSSAAMDTAITSSVAAGVTYAVAAGNSDADASTHSPANHPDVITVSALADFNGQPGGGGSPTCRTDQDDTLADFSNWGSTIEIAAPGVCILSTVPGGGYDNTFSGTSMASPHVAGAAALRAATAPGDSPAQIRTTLITTGNSNWTDDSGDRIKEPLLDVSNTTAFNPATVAGPGGAVNDAPVAVDDAYSTPTGTTLAVTEPGVLANDSDVDADPISAVAVIGETSANGSFNLLTDGSFTYSPPSSTFTGSDSFTYTVSDGDLTDTGTVTISVGSVMTIADMAGSSTNQGSTWSAIVTITIADGDGVGVEGASVSGTWTYNGNSFADTCTTGETGQCTVDLTGIPKRFGSVTFTTSIVDDGGAHTWDGFNESEIVSKP